MFPGATDPSFWVMRAKKSRSRTCARPVSGCIRNGSVSIWQFSRSLSSFVGAHGRHSYCNVAINESFSDLNSLNAANIGWSCARKKDHGISSRRHIGNAKTSSQRIILTVVAVLADRFCSMAQARGPRPDGSIETAVDLRRLLEARDGDRRRAAAVDHLFRERSCGCPRTDPVVEQLASMREGRAAVRTR